MILTNWDVPALNGWPDIAPNKQQTFASPPQPVELPTGTKVYRLVGKDPKYDTNDYAGEWWGLKPPPETESEWRSGYAVKNEWNGDGGYIEQKITGPLKCWIGPTGPQNSTVAGFILKGGELQIWVPRGTIDPLSGGRKKIDVTKPSPWNSK